MAGAPKGNTNASTGREARRALEMALDHYPEVPKTIKRMQTIIKMWYPVIARAMEEGDLLAIKEINDRLDGKPAQAITGADGGPIEFTAIERNIVDPTNTDS